MIDEYSRLNENILFVFQPHTYSRTKYLIDEFKEVFNSVENLILYKTYSAREDYDFYGSSEYMFECIKEVNSNIKYFENPKKIWGKNFLNIDF